MVFWISVWGRILFSQNSYIEILTASPQKWLYLEMGLERSN